MMAYHGTEKNDPPATDGLTTMVRYGSKRTERQQTEVG